MNSSRVPTVNLTRKALDPIVTKGTGKSLEQLEKQIGESKKPASQPINGIKVTGSTEIGPMNATVRNVAAILKGKGSLADEYVIVGAHYDHVGMGGEGSLAPGTIAVHNGADDNGSGTISILEIARQLSKFKAENHRTIIFMTFAAEERGLLGSEHYVRHPVVPLEQTAAMVNLDMVGRLGDGSVTVFGMGTGEEFSDWIDEANKPFGVELNKENAGMGPSDHQSFFLRNIPVFHFFTGLHGEYHRPSDDVNLIDFKGVAKITQLTSKLTEKLATNKDRPTFKKSTERARIGPNAGRKKPTLGVSLDGDAKQCVVTSVADPSPAKTAGIMAGDIVLKVNSKSVASSDELVNAIGAFKIGEEIEIQLKRGDQAMTVKAKL
ncbi:MAG: M28 family peptidase [Pirellulales bacterium]